MTIGNSKIHHNVSAGRPVRCAGVDAALRAMGREGHLRRFLGMKVRAGRW